MKIKKNASILLYSILLTGLALTLWVIILNNYSLLVLNNSNLEIHKQINSTINSNIKITGNFLRHFNSNWSWFTDSTSWSWTNIKCTSQSAWGYLIEWDDWTKSSIDNIDDNCNDDNYLSSNSGSVNYPMNFQDDDDTHRKIINSYIPPLITKNIFWNNYKIEKYINDNPNNSWSLNSKLWQTSSWYLYLDLSSSWKILVLQIDKNKYTNFNEIKKTDSFSWVINSSSSWYIVNDSGLSLSSSTSSAYIFDFSVNDYLIFITNYNNILEYKLKWETDVGSGIFLNPVNDDILETDSFKMLWYDVVINNNWDIIWKIFEWKWKK